MGYHDDLSEDDGYVHLTMDDMWALYYQARRRIEALPLEAQSTFYIIEPAEGIKAIEFWWRMQICIEQLAFWYVKPGSGGGVSGYDGQSEIRAWVSVAHGGQFPPDGWTRRRPREIATLSDSGSTGQVARFAVRRYVTAEGERANALKLYQHNGTTWLPYVGDRVLPDIIESLGTMAEGDIVGPWIRNECRDALGMLDSTLQETSTSGGYGYAHDVLTSSTPNVGTYDYAAETTVTAASKGGYSSGTEYRSWAIAEDRYNANADPDWYSLSDVYRVAYETAGGDGFRAFGLKSQRGWIRANFAAGIDTPRKVIALHRAEAPVGWVFDDNGDGVSNTLWREHDVQDSVGEHYVSPELASLSVPHYVEFSANFRGYVLRGLVTIVKWDFEYDL